MCHADEHRTEALPLVLLGIHSVWKEDLNTSSAELVYVSPLRLPGEFFVPFPAECTDITTFASRLRVHIAKLQPVPASRHATPSTFIFKDLATASHVFLWQGALQAPYLGLYRVLHRGEKTYSIEVNGAATTVSIDRLKLAYVLHSDTEPASPLAIPPRVTTRSGRCTLTGLPGVQQSQRRGGMANVTAWTTHIAPDFLGV
jgi:hypothetical protein